MMLQEVLKESIHIVRRNRSVWIFGLLLSVDIFFTSFRAALENLFLVCIYLLGGILLLFVSFSSLVSAIYVISNARMGKEISLSQAWSQAGRNIFQLLFYLLVITPISLVIAYLSDKVVLGLPSFYWQAIWIFISTTFLYSFFTFGICSIVIHQIHAVPAMWTSLLITTNNLLRLAAINGMFFLINFVLITSLLLLFLLTPLRTNLPTSLGINYETYQNLLHIPQFTWFNRMISIVLTPLYLTVLTVAYLRFTEEVAYPSLVQS
jgi:hypothetical protein